jgi:uncharacterized membrane protein YhaH (DUF805 family)
MNINAIIDNFRRILTEHYVDFQGRAPRAEFWYFVLAYFVIDIVLAIIQLTLGLSNVLTGLFALAILLPNLGLAVRRLHDIGRSGWWILIGIIPIAGWILLIYWYAQPGTSGTNEFGAEPKSAIAA